MNKENQPGLRRSLGLFELAAYGVGDILGAGVYALIGCIAGMVGNAAWMAFLFSLVAASLTGLSYAELVSRYPRSGGEAHYTFQAFRNPLLSYALGFFVLMTGVGSMSVVSHAFAAYVRAILPAIPEALIVVLFFSTLAWIAYRGMDESSLTNVVCTAVEISGLLVVIVAGLACFGKVNYFEFVPSATGLDGKAGVIFSGALLAFYAFIGFEDMVKASEEAKNPERDLPRAILIALGTVGVLYLLTAVAAVSVVPAGELARSDAPLMLVVKKGAPWVPPGLFTLVVLFSVTNTALVNFVMSSRLLYGMSGDRLVPKIFGKVHPERRTPHVAIVTVFVMALALALTGTLTRLAQSTAFLLLVVYLFVNLSLLKIKSGNAVRPSGFGVPRWVPVLGVLFTLFLAFHVSFGALLTAAVLLAVALLLFVFS